MARFKKTWTDTDNTEFDALVNEALALDVSNADRWRKFADLIADAIQAHRIWARDVHRAALAAGFQIIWRRSTRRGTVKVLVNGREIEKPAQLSVKRESATGQRFQQLAFFDQLSLAQVKEKRLEYRITRSAYDDNIATLDKIEDFILTARTTTVAGAEEKLGLTLDAWLARKAA